MNKRGIMMLVFVGVISSVLLFCANPALADDAIVKVMLSRTAVKTLSDIEGFGQGFDNPVCVSVVVENLSATVRTIQFQDRYYVALIRAYDIGQGLYDIKKDPFGRSIVLDTYLKPTHTGSILLAPHTQMVVATRQITGRDEPRYTYKHTIARMPYIVSVNTGRIGLPGLFASDTTEATLSAE